MYDVNKTQVGESEGHSHSEVHIFNNKKNIFQQRIAPNPSYRLRGFDQVSTHLKEAERGFNSL